MDVLFKGCTTIAEHYRFDIAQMCVSQSRRYAAIGDDAANDQIIDANSTHDVFKSRLVKGGISNLFDDKIRRVQSVYNFMAKRSGRKVAFGKERT